MVQAEMATCRLTALRLQQSQAHRTACVHPSTLGCCLLPASAAISQHRAIREAESHVHDAADQAE